MNKAASVIPRACASFPETPIVPQEDEGDDTTIVEAEGMDQTQEANEDAV